MLVKISALKCVNIQKKLLRTWQRKDRTNLHVAYFLFGNMYFKHTAVEVQLGRTCKILLMYENKCKTWIT